MSSPASISVNDDLSACQPSITLWTADDELAGRVDVQMRVVSVQTQGRLSVFQCYFCQCLLHDLLHDKLVHLLHAWGCCVRAFVASHLLAASGRRWFRMLRGDHNGMNLLRLNRAILPLQILDGD